jgi:methyl-accepting chemotaxis protein
MKWFHDMNIGKKLLLGFAVVALLAGLVGVKGILSLKRANTSEMRTYEHVTVPISQLTALNVAFLRQRTDALQMAMSADPVFRADRLQKVKDRAADIDRVTAALAGSIVDDSVKVQFDALCALQKEYVVMLGKLIDLSGQGKTDEAVEFFKGDMDKARYKVIAALDLMTMTQIREAKSVADENKNDSDSALIMMVCAVVAAIGAAMGLGYFISHHLAVPIRKLFTAASEVSKGNLHVSVESSAEDEVGKLSRVFNEMVANIRSAQEAVRAEKAGVEMKVEAAVAQIKEEQLYLQSSIDILLAEMNKFADGDLTVNVKALRDDAIGKLFAGFNHSVKKIHRLLSSVAEATAALASASAEISSSTEEMAAGAHEQTQQTTEVSGAIDEMTKTIMDTSKNASLAAETAKLAGDNAKDGGKVVMDTISGMNRIADVVKQSASTVEALGKSSDQIGEIVQVIDDIADQTNLLALNAAIEAARAGEQGRGFAVVADEVRKLAERTTKATKEIAQMIKQIQKDTADAVSSMHTGTEEVDRGRTMADKAGASLREIITGAEKVVDVATQVAAASEEQSSAAEEIGKNIEAIANVTQESAAGTQQIAHAAEDLNRLTTNLQDLVNQFKLDAGGQRLNNGTSMIELSKSDRRLAYR